MELKERREQSDVFEKDIDGLRTAKDRLKTRERRGGRPVVVT